MKEATKAKTELIRVLGEFEESLGEFEEGDEYYQEIQVMIKNARDEGLVDLQVRETTMMMITTRIMITIKIMITKMIMIAIMISSISS